MNNPKFSKKTILIFAFVAVSAVCAYGLLFHKPKYPVWNAHRLTTKEANELKAYLPAAEKGDPAAQMKVGDLYAPKYGIGRLDCMAGDYECWSGVAKLERQWRAEVTGDGYVSGYSKIRGNGAEALKWWWKAADQGSEESQDRVVSFYRQQEIYKEDAKAGDLASQARIVSNIPSLQDYNAALFKWDQASAAEGNPEAQYRLGIRFLNGTGVQKDNVQGLEWLKKAGSGGGADIQYKIGWAYFSGKEIPKDYVEAYFWYSLSANADSRHLASRDEVSAKLTAEQIEAVDKRVKEWAPVK